MECHSRVVGELTRVHDGELHRDLFIPFYRRDTLISLSQGEDVGLRLLSCLYGDATSLFGEVHPLIASGIVFGVISHIELIGSRLVGGEVDLKLNVIRALTSYTYFLGSEYRLAVFRRRRSDTEG